MASSSARFIGIRDLTALTNYVKIQTKSVGLNVVFDEDCNVPRVSKQTMYIPAPALNMTDDDVARLRCAVIHECNHVRHGPELLEDKGGPASHIDPQSPLFVLINMIEDGRIDRIQAKRYIGDGVALSEGHRIIGAQISEKFTKFAAEEGLDKLDPMTLKISCATVVGMEANEDWDVGLQIGMRPYHKLLETDPNTADLVKKLRDLDYPRRIRNVRTAVDVVQLATELAKDLDIDTSKMTDPSQWKQSGSGEDGEDSGNEEGKSGSKSKAGKGKKGANGGAKPEDKIDISDLLWSDHQEDSGWGNGSGQGFDWNTKREHGKKWVPEPPCEVHTMDYTGKRMTVRAGEASCLREITKQVESIDHAALANNVRRYLQVRSATMYNSGYKSGSLNNKALYRVAMPVVGNGDFNSKVFRRKEEHDILDVAVSLVVDASGSMDGIKYVTAANAAIQLDRLFGHALRIPCEVITFSTGGRRGRNVMGVIKSFGEKPPESEVATRFAAFSQHMSGNGDPDAILFAYNRIKDRSEKRKVIIVLSDGSPSFAVDGDPDFGLKQVTGDIERSGVVELHGIGIQDTNVRRFYKNNVVINRVSDLDTKLIELLKRIILKGDV